jgi:hypothetical protein
VAGSVLLAMEQIMGQQAYRVRPVLIESVRQAQNQFIR